MKIHPLCPVRILFQISLTLLFLSSVGSETASAETETETETLVSETRPRQRQLFSESAETETEIEAVSSKTETLLPETLNETLLISRRCTHFFHIPTYLIAIIDY